jgi:hypothetical protein
MPVAEIELAVIIAGWLIWGAWLSRQKFRRVLEVYALGCAAGWLAQLGLGPGMNRYTPNVTVYFSYVSLAVILAWGTGLAMMWAAHLAFSRWLRRRPGLHLFLLAGAPVMTILEFIGSNVIHMKLHNYRQYASLMPMLNSMHAPLWLFVYYGVCAILFYGLLIALRIHTAEGRPFRETGTSRGPARGYRVTTERSGTVSPDR